MNKVILCLILSAGVCASASATEYAGLKMQEGPALTTPNLIARVNLAALKRSEELMAALRKDLPKANESADYLARKLVSVELATGELVALLSKNRDDDELHAYVLHEMLKTLAGNPSYNAYGTYILKELCHLTKDKIGYHQETGDLNNLMVRAMVAGLKEAKTLSQSDDYLTLLYQYTRHCIPMTKNVAGNLLGQMLKNVKDLPLAIHIKRTASVIVL